MVDWESDESHLLLNPRGHGDWSDADLPDLSGHIWLETSGSSGRPKLVGLSKAAMLSSAESVNAHIQSTAKDIWLKALPSFHVGGLSIEARSFLSGAAVIDQSDQAWSAAGLISKIQSSHATLVSLVPTQVFDLIAMKASCPPSVRVVFVGGGALPVAHYGEAVALGWPLLPTYGMTEASSQVATARLSDIGKKQPPPIQALAHINLKEVEGRLAISSSSLFSGYVEKSDSGARFVDPKTKGWFLTSDLVQVDGRTIIPLGRADRQVKILGELVHLDEIQRRLQVVLAARGLADEACVLAIPDARKGFELIMVLTKEAYCLRQNLIDDLQLRPFEVIRLAYLVDEIPRSPLGKIQTSALLEHIRPQSCSLVTS